MSVVVVVAVAVAVAAAAAAVTVESVGVLLMVSRSRRMDFFATEVLWLLLLLCTVLCTSRTVFDSQDSYFLKAMSAFSAPKPVCRRSGFVLVSPVVGLPLFVGLVIQILSRFGLMPLSLLVVCF